MLRSLDLTKTQAGKDLIAIGKVKGLEEGLAEGKAEGKAQTLLKILAKRLGKLPKSMVTKVEHLNFLQLEKLEDVVLDLPDQAALGALLKKLGR